VATRSTDYDWRSNWNEDTEPPVVNNVPDKYDLGCNPAELPTCEDLIVASGSRRRTIALTSLRRFAASQVRWWIWLQLPLRQTFRFWAVDKCGNRSDDYPLEVNWRVDNEPPVIEPPDGGDLGCNPREFPDLRLCWIGPPSPTTAIRTNLPSGLPL
jgi:hypothetical protein